MDASGVGPGDFVLDVGAGRGAIAAVLVERGAEVWAVEADPALAASLRERFGPRARVVEADARRLSWPRRPFTVVANLPFTVVANLPFAGATAILDSLLADPAVPLCRAAFVLQWEVAAKRAAIWPSTLLGVVWGALYELRLVGRLAPTAFAPPPSVDAGVLRAVRRSEPLVPDHRLGAYGRFVRAAFESKAPVRRVLPARVVKRLADELGFSPAAYPRDLDACQWAELFARSRVGVNGRGR